MNGCRFRQKNIRQLSVDFVSVHTTDADYTICNQNIARKTMWNLLHLVVQSISYSFFVDILEILSNQPVNQWPVKVYWASAYSSVRTRSQNRMTWLLKAPNPVGFLQTSSRLCLSSFYLPELWTLCSGFQFQCEASIYRGLYFLLVKNTESTWSTLKSHANSLHCGIKSWTKCNGLDWHCTFFHVTYESRLCSRLNSELFRVCGGEGRFLRASLFSSAGGSSTTTECTRNAHEPYVPMQIPIAHNVPEWREMKEQLFDCR